MGVGVCVCVCASRCMCACAQQGLDVMEFECLSITQPSQEISVQR